MGYGHLRAARPLADAFGTGLLHADRAPLAGPEEQRQWKWARRGHELLSQPFQLGLLGDSQGLMDRVTSIPPLYAMADHSLPNAGARLLDWLITQGLGRGLVEYLENSGAPLITTFYAPAIIADRAGLSQIYCVVTDADINRVWAPMQARHSRIHYFAPSHRVIRRLVSYGVPRERITMTGFPLPPALLGRDLASLRRSLARRLVRLDPEGVFRELFGYDVERALGTLPSDEEGAPPHLAFAVGGAGAQAEMANQFLPSLRDAVVAGNLRLTLVAGTRPDVRDIFLSAAERAGLGAQVGRAVSILEAPDFDAYYDAFNRLLVDVDVLWTKPSELSFYAALGVALILAKPVGGHERFNRQWLREQGVALKAHDPRHAGGWLNEWLRDGTLAAAAWSGFVRLPKDGTHRVLAEVRRASEERHAVCPEADAAVDGAGADRAL